MKIIKNQNKLEKNRKNQKKTVNNMWITIQKSNI